MMIRRAWRVAGQTVLGRRDAVLLLRQSAGSRQSQTSCCRSKDMYRIVEEAKARTSGLGKRVRLSMSIRQEK